MEESQLNEDQAFCDQKTQKSKDGTVYVYDGGTCVVKGTEGKGSMKGKGTNDDKGAVKSPEETCKAKGPNHVYIKSSGSCSKDDCGKGQFLNPETGRCKLDL